MDVPLDGGAMIAQRGEHWCCLLCLRQFKSEAQVAKHISRSTLHADNLNSAIAQGRVPESAMPTSEAAEGDGSERERPPKRSAPEGDAGGTSGGAGSSGGGGGGAMSALEQMELFEKRLKVQARHAPDKPKGSSKEEEAIVDSNHARTINRQMDWECSGCGTFNFARVVVCIECKRHVDSSTIYLSNRLKELKRQRFANAFQSDETFARFAPAPPQPQRTERADGSFGDGKPGGGGGAGGGRAAFSQ